MQLKTILAFVLFLATASVGFCQDSIGRVELTYRFFQGKQEMESTEYGTFFVIEDNLAATNEHVIRSAVEHDNAKIVLVFPGEKPQVGTVVKFDKNLDLALVHFDSPWRSHVSLSTAAEDQESPPWVKTTGWKFGEKLTTASGTFHAKTSSATGTPDSGFMFKGRVFQGQSGSPVFNRRNELVGVLYAQSIPDDRPPFYGFCVNLKSFIGFIGGQTGIRSVPKR